jgi:hypothetical protein
MKKYMLLYKNPSTENWATMTPDSMKAMMDQWMAWYGRAGSAVVDGGTPLRSLLQIGAGNAAAASNPVSGYTIVQADDMDSLKPLLDSHPHLMTPGSNIEVLELMPMAG